MVAGRIFRPATPLTFAQRLYGTAQLRAAGAQYTSGDASDIVDALMLVGRIPNLIASRYVLDGAAEWTDAGAEEAAGIIRRVTDPDDCQTLEDTAVEVLTDFFGLARPSAPTSPTSTPTSQDPPGPTAVTTTSASSVP